MPWLSQASRLTRILREINSKILLFCHINHHTILSFLIHLNIVFFSENGCQEHYEPAGDICIRASIFPETYENAQKRCENDGGYLLSITSQKIQVYHNNLTCSRERIKFKFFDLNIFSNFLFYIYNRMMYNKPSIERNQLLPDLTVIIICGSGLIIDQLVENGNGEMRSLDLMVL